MFSSLFRMVVIEMPQTSMMSSAYPYFHISHLEGLTCCHVCVSSLQQYSNIHQNVCCQAVPECDTFPRDANLHISSLRSNIISIRHLFLDFKECMFVLSPVAYFLYQLSDLQLLNKFSVAWSCFLNLWSGHVNCSKELYVSYLTPLCSSPNIISAKSDRITNWPLLHAVQPPRTHGQKPPKTMYRTV